jgi:hypothetical protein
MSYAKIRNFGTSTTQPNYYAAALNSTINGNFYMAQPAFQFDNRSLNGQLLLSSHIADNSEKSNKFDDVSLAAINLKGSGFPNQVPNSYYDSKPYSPNTVLQYGDMFVENAARMRYCIYPNGSYYKFPYNPYDPDSPMLTQIIGTDSLTPVCTVDPSRVDNDPLMNRILEQPEKHTNLLNNIYKNTKGLEGTRLGQFFADNTPYFKNYAAASNINSGCNYS